MTAADRRARFRELHERKQLFVMPNPWDVGSAKLLASLGFEALATTSAGLAWALGKLDGKVTRDELVAHVAALADATPLPLNVDSERCYPDDPGGDRGDGAAARRRRCGWVLDRGLRPRRGHRRARASRRSASRSRRRPRTRWPEPLVLTARAENHIRGVDDFEDTVARLVAYRDAGADAVYAPGLRDLDQIARLVDEVGIPVNVLALASGPSVADLASVGVRRVSTGGALAAVAYGALVSGARELQGRAHRSIEGAVSRDALDAAFG